MALMRGMKPWRHDAIPIRLADVLVRPKLPAVPAQYGHVTTNTVKWQMDGNDTAGDCVCAGGEHEHIVDALATGKPIPKFGTKVSLENYSAMLVAEGGQPYNPNDASTDTGLDPVMAMQYRQSTGLTDASGNVHKIDAFASVSLSHVDLAAYMFGSCGMGWDLPDSAETEFGHMPWTDTSGNGTGGHYTPLVGRNSHGLRFVVTWGALQAATDAWVNTYFQGAVVALSREYMLATGQSPEGIDWDKLNTLLAQIETQQRRA